MKIRLRRRRPHRERPLEQPVWCGICHIRVAPYERAIKVMDKIYHAHCLDDLRPEGFSGLPVRSN